MTKLDHEIISYKLTSLIGSMMAMGTLLLMEIRGHSWIGWLATVVFAVGSYLAELVANKLLKSKK